MIFQLDTSNLKQCSYFRNTLARSQGDGLVCNQQCSQSKSIFPSLQGNKYTQVNLILYIQFIKQINYAFFSVDRPIAVLLIQLRQITVYQDSKNIYSQIFWVILSVKFEEHLYQTINFILLIAIKESPFAPLSQNIILLSKFLSKFERCFYTCSIKLYTDKTKYQRKCFLPQCNWLKKNRLG